MEPLTKRHGNALRLTAAGAALMAQRIAELRDTPGNELIEILNREFRLNWSRPVYWHHVVYKLGLDWTPATPRPPEVPPGELPMCSHCGKVRTPVRYSLANKGGRLVLCEDRCCPTCGGKLELHRVLDKATGKPHSGYWAHALPLLPRNCVNPKCGKQFTPANTKKAHQEACSPACTAIIGTRKWQNSHPDQVREQNKQGAERRQAKVRAVWRLKNIEGLDLKTGLRASLAAHWTLLLEDKSQYEQAQATCQRLYSDSADPLNATKQFLRRWPQVIEDEKQRVAKLDEDQRQMEVKDLEARLERELAKPLKKAS